MASFSAICTFLGTGTVRTFGLAFAGHRIVWVVGTQTNIKNSNLKMCFSSIRNSYYLSGSKGFGSLGR